MTAPDEKAELLPCPFCGGEAEIRKETRKFGLYVACTVCAASTRTVQADVAAGEAWNTRTALCPAPMETCPDCNGSGEYAAWGGECPRCGGTGGIPAPPVSQGG